MNVFVAKKFVIVLITLLIVSILAFLVPYVGSDDPARAILRARTVDDALDPAAIEALRAELGLNRSLIAQYLGWLWRALHLDFGYSFATRTAVDVMFVQALKVTSLLAISALILAMVIAVPLGTIAAMRPARMFDNAVTVFTQTLIAIPEYWAGPLLVLFFSIHMGWLPSAGWRDFNSTILPVVVLSLRPIAYFTQVSRSAMVEVLRAPYIGAARGRGLTASQTLVRHGLRNGMLPVITMFSLWLTSLLGGSVVVEVIFGIPGMGWLLYDAVLNNDAPLIQASIVFIVALAALINTITDIGYALLNPSVRLTHDKA
ncbi:ABC transporter permease [Microvirga alba]|uniref:ABC transporter permease n=1 Tax=Microvirga alba TaxID=2791025 RepID=A0A931BQ05_9HYPH|nr:ABC transporter permease [Microvirga alba]MBF9235332.1 ABC transporter permease [Microvirga alba]